MNRTPIESKTGMCGVAYDPSTQTLEIEFKSRKEGEPNKIYHYSSFTHKDWEAFQAAESKGSHFIKSIKPVFSCKRMPEEVPDAAKAKT